MRPALVLVLAFAVTACGGEREHGTATLWVTRDRGAQVLYTGTVPAGLTAMQALERVRKVSTRYGGRFVQSIDGVDGSATKQRDWFYFVDGIEGDRSAAEVTLHPGDVEWWDYRSWTGSSMSVPVVVGAYPKPFARHDDERRRGRCRPDRRGGDRAAGPRHGRADEADTAAPSSSARSSRPTTCGSRGSGSGFRLELGAACRAPPRRRPDRVSLPLRRRAVSAGPASALLAALVVAALLTGRDLRRSRSSASSCSWPRCARRPSGAGRTWSGR